MPNKDRKKFPNTAEGKKMDANAMKKKKKTKKKSKKK